MSQLVVYGTTGRRVQFSKEDLRPPPKEVLIKKYGETIASFILKQWSVVANFWMHRVVKETKYHNASVADIIDKVEEELVHRFHKRREDQQLHKKRKKMLENEDPDVGAGIPSTQALFVNFVSLSDFDRDQPYSDSLVEAILDRCKELVGEEHVVGHRVLVDRSELPSGSDGGGAAAVTKVEEEEDAVEPPTTHGRRIDVQTTPEDISATTTEKDASFGNAAVAAADPSQQQHTVVVPPPPSFDDRVALIISFARKEDAATAILKHHRQALDGRHLCCRFFHE